MERPKILVLLSITGLIAILSSTASKSPTLPLFAKYLGAKPEEIGLIAAASTIVGIVVNVTAGTLSDVYGRRKLLILSGFFFASSPFLYLYVSEPWQLIIVRAYHGVATAVFTPVAIAAIADIYSERRGEMMGYFSSATLFGRLLAPSMAGAVITLYSFYETYMLCGIFGVIALTILLGFPETSKPKSTIKKPPSSKVVGALTNPGVLLAGGVMALTYFAMQSIETFLPLYMETIGMGAWISGTTLTIELAVLAILKPYGGYLYDRFGGGKIVCLGAALSALGVSTIAFSATYISILPSIILFSVGVAFITASIPPLVSKITSKETHGTALGAMETIKDVGQALGPVVMGFILIYISYNLAFIIIGIITSLTILLNIVLYRYSTVRT